MYGSCENNKKKIGNRIINKRKQEKKKKEEKINKNYSQLDIDKLDEIFYYINKDDNHYHPCYFRKNGLGWDNHYLRLGR